MIKQSISGWTLLRSPPPSEILSVHVKCTILSPSCRDRIEIVDIKRMIDVGTTTHLKAQFSRRPQSYRTVQFDTLLVPEIMGVSTHPYDFNFAHSRICYEFSINKMADPSVDPELYRRGTLESHVSVGWVS